METHVFSEMIRIIKTTVTEGKGTEDDPCRRVSYYFDLRGELLFKEDEWLEDRRKK